MTDRDRLIEITEKSFAEQYEKRGLLTAQHTAADLLANGVIVPPCKVGDIVWDRKGEPHKVISIEWYSKKVMHLHCEHHTFSVGKRSIGKTVFLTKEEAEAKLKELNKDE